jgi:hypothetical protein
MPATVSRKDFVKDCLLGWGSLLAGLSAALAMIKREAAAAAWSGQPLPRISRPDGSVKRNVRA